MEAATIPSTADETESARNQTEKDSRLGVFVRIIKWKLFFQITSKSKCTVFKFRKNELLFG